MSTILQIVIWGAGMTLTLYVAGVSFVMEAIDLIMAIIEIAQLGITQEVIGKTVCSFIELLATVFIAWVILSITGLISATLYI